MQRRSFLSVLASLVVAPWMGLSKKPVAVDVNLDHNRITHYLEVQQSAMYDKFYLVSEESLWEIRS